MKNKFLNMKSVSVFFAVILSTLIFQSMSYSIPTKWEAVDLSLSQLLNSGWQISNHSSNQVAFRNTVSPGGLDEETFTFVLTKNGKYIMCRVVNLSSPVANLSGCRKLN